MEGAAVSERRVVGSYEESFKRELEHFHHCVTKNERPLTDAKEAKKDIELLRSVVLRYMDGEGRQGRS